MDLWLFLYSKPLFLTKFCMLRQFYLNTWLKVKSTDIQKQQIYSGCFCWHLNCLQLARRKTDNMAERSPGEIQHHSPTALQISIQDLNLSVRIHPVLWKMDRIFSTSCHYLCKYQRILFGISAIDLPLLFGYLTEGQKHMLQRVWHTVSRWSFTHYYYDLEKLAEKAQYDLFRHSCHKGHCLSTW